jgi:hypothetical protein
MDGLVSETFFDSTLKLLEQWNAGNQTRELGLDLMFHCWYLLEEPAMHTDYNLIVVENSKLTTIFNEVHDSFALGIRNDPEMLYTVGLMAQLHPWLLGDKDVWIKRGIEYRDFYEQLEPNGLDPELFENRGEYGEYFAHQIRYAREHSWT